MTVGISTWLEQTLYLTPEVQSKLIITLIVFILLWLLRRAVVGVIRRRVEDVRLRYSWQKAFGYVVIVLGILLLGPVWFQGLQNAATYLGLLTAGLAIALRDLITGFVGWVFILVSRPFAVGDRIQIGDIAGDVIDLRIFQFTLLEIGNWVGADQSTGRVVHIPNGRVFSESIANYETGFRFIWNEISVTITMDSDWKAAKAVLQQIADKHAGEVGAIAERRVKEASLKFMIYYANLNPTVYTCVVDKGILLTIRYLCEPRLRRTSADRMWEDILQELVQHPEIRIVHVP